MSINKKQKLILNLLRLQVVHILIKNMPLFVKN